jgi:flagellar hook-associated protein 1 FlgK
VSGLFSTFNVAKRGMFVAQKTIDVTSHNIANANTEGYSRQRAKIQTTRPQGMPSLNSVAEPGQLGTGAEISAIERVRDSFLDYQVRTETSTFGQYDARNSYLSQIESILNEPSDTGLSTLIGKFYDSWQQLSKQPQSSNARTVVAQQSLALTNDLNHTYTQLQKLKTNAQSSVNSSVFDVNSMLNQVDQLNQQIVQVKVAGNMPNDLMDKRDLLLDQLSQKFNINIDKKALEGYDVKAADIAGIVNPNFINAVIDGSEKRLSYIDSMQTDSTNPDPSVPPDPLKTTYDITVTYYKLGDKSTEANKMTMKLKGLSQSDLKSMDQCRVLWSNKDGVAIDGSGNPIPDYATTTPTPAALDYTNSGVKPKLYQPTDGELKGYMSVQSDIDDYTDEINRLAKAIAFTVNAVHAGTDVASSDSLPFFVNSTDNTDETGITAGNITVNKSIVDNVMTIKVGTNPDETKNGETDGNRALAIAQLRDAIIKIQNIDDTTTRDGFVDFSSTDTNKLEIQYDVNGMKVDSYFKDTVDRLGVQAQEATRMVNNQESLLNSFEESRMSVSGVSLDEEMANLVQYQHAYTANAKMISTIDELLDVVVNGLKK